MTGKVKIISTVQRTSGEIIVNRAGGVISGHCGPGTLEVLYIAGEE